MTRTNSHRMPVTANICHPAAQAEAIRLMAEHNGRALRVVENKLNDQLAKGDFTAVLHLDQVRRCLSQADIGQTGIE